MSEQVGYAGDGDTGEMDASPIMPAIIRDLLGQPAPDQALAWIDRRLKMQQIRINWAQHHADEAESRYDPYGQDPVRYVALWQQLAEARRDHDAEHEEFERLLAIRDLAGQGDESTVAALAGEFQEWAGNLMRLLELTDQV